MQADLHAKRVRYRYPDLRAVLSEIASEGRLATGSIAGADQALSQPEALPPELRAEMSTAPQNGRPEEWNDRLIEPLLTASEVASSSGSRRDAVRLPLRTIVLAGEGR